MTTLIVQEKLDIHFEPGAQICKGISILGLIFGFMGVAPKIGRIWIQTKFHLIVFFLLRLFVKSVFNLFLSHAKFDINSIESKYAYTPHHF